MAGYKTIMRTGSIYNTNSDGVPFFTDVFEVESMEYSFDRGISDNGNLPLLSLAVWLPLHSGDFLPNIFINGFLEVKKG